MELKDLIPVSPEFFLTSKQKTYELRIPNMEDRIYYNSKYGADQNINEIFEKKNWPEIFKISYRLLKDKSDFMSAEVTEINDEGVMEKKVISGLTYFIRAFGGTEELMRFLGAVTAAFVAGEPLARAYVESEVKKNQSEQLTMLKSLTSSQANTDTPSSNLGS